MSRASAASLLSLVESYFREHLVGTRGASPHTVRAYRDTLRLLFRFVADRLHRAVADLTLDDLKVGGARIPRAPRGAPRQHGRQS